VIIIGVYLAFLKSSVINTVMYAFYFYKSTMFEFSSLKW
jgi:hypothetical protein